MNFEESSNEVYIIKIFDHRVSYTVPTVLEYYADIKYIGQVMEAKRKKRENRKAPKVPLQTNDSSFHSEIVIDIGFDVDCMAVCA